MTNRDTFKITVTKDGPYRVEGGVPLARQVIVADSAGASRQWQTADALDAPNDYSLCRCGQSGSKPFCDGTHARVGFDGTETASRASYLDQSGLLEGPSLLLTDAESLCAYARFCDPDGSIWGLIEATDNPDVRDKVIGMAHSCPSGRLVVWDKETRQAIEPDLEPSIGVVEDPQEDVSGPLWVRGGIRIESADGTAYEVRNRVTVCRCGASSNKPFCDGSHASIGFKDYE
jgi:CDGSH-type Zn-finger protein